MKVEVEDITRVAEMAAEWGHGPQGLLRSR